MHLRGDDRAVTVQIGTVMLFGVLIVSMSIYQASVVPFENERVEYDHNQRVQDQLVDVRNAVLRSAATGRARPASVTLGTTYSRRTFSVNPPPATGTIGTAPLGVVGISNATAGGEAGDYWNGSAYEFETDGLDYEPNYAEYGNAPTTRYEHSVLYNRFDGETAIPLTGQALVDGRRITVLTLAGNVSRSGRATVAVAPQPASAEMRTVSVTNTPGESLTITLRTHLPRSRWESLLAQELATGYLASFDYDDSTSPATVTLTFEPGEEYSLRMAKVGVGGTAPETSPHYLHSTHPTAESITVHEATTKHLSVEVRNRYNNPVAGETVNVTLDGAGTLTAGGRSGTALTNVTVNENGRARFAYDAPDVDDGESVDIRVSYDEDPNSTAFDPSTRPDLNFTVDLVNTDMSEGTMAEETDLRLESVDVYGDQNATVYFALENGASVDAEITHVQIPDADAEIDRVERDKPNDPEFQRTDGPGAEYDTIFAGGAERELDTPATVPSKHTAGFELKRFRGSSGGTIDMHARTFDVRLTFGDGSSATYTVETPSS